MAKEDSGALSQMIALRANIEARLRATSEDYRALLALDAAISATSSSDASRTRERIALPIGNALAEVSRTTNALAALEAAFPGRRRPTLADAAERGLKECGTPMSVVDLAAYLLAMGELGGGSDGAATLSSTLSRDSRFVSLKFNGKRCWWLKGVGNFVDGDEEEVV